MFIGFQEMFIKFGSEIQGGGLGERGVALAEERRLRRPRALGVAAHLRLAGGVPDRVANRLRLAGGVPDCVANSFKIKRATR